MELHFIARLTSAWPVFVRLSDMMPGNPGLELQCDVLSQFGTLNISVCAQPESSRDQLIKSLSFPVSENTKLCYTPFENVTDDSIVFLFDAPAFLNEAGVVSVLDALYYRHDQSFHLYTAEGRPMPVYALHGREARNFTHKKAQSLIVPSLLPLTAAGDIYDFREKVRTNIIRRHIENGVVLQAPESVVIDHHVSIAPDTFIGPGVVLRGETTIGPGCKISQGALIDTCKIGERCSINASQIYMSTLERDVTVGPYAYVRPGCYLSAGSKVGSFVELKNTEVGSNSSIPHLSYVGDSQVGSHVNIGCGVITANFNGIGKFRTTIKDEAFIGSNSVLVAPITVGECAVVAAGSTVTHDVPPYALGLARARQVNKEDWAKSRERNW